MAAKIIILLASLHIITKSVLSAPAITANDLCKCEGENSEEIEELWKFLKEIDSKLEELPVAPGQLSALVPCSNCIEYNRQKRKIVPADMVEKDSSEEVSHPAAERKDAEKSVKIEEEDSDTSQSEEHSEGRQSDYDQILNPKLGQFDKNCPAGTIRVGIWCVSEHELSDEDYYE